MNRPLVFLIKKFGKLLLGATITLLQLNHIHSAAIKSHSQRGDYYKLFNKRSVLIRGLMVQAYYTDQNIAPSKMQ